MKTYHGAINIKTMRASAPMAGLKVFHDKLVFSILGIHILTLDKSEIRNHKY